MDLEMLGWVRSVLLTLCSVPQVIKCHKEQHAKGLAWSFLLMWLVGLLFSVVYSIEKTALPLIVGDAVNVFLVGYLISIKWKENK